MYAEVLVEITNKNIDKTFTYHIPSRFFSFVQKGIRVEVPFQNRTLEGFILQISDVEPSYPVKDILRVIDEEVVLSDELLELGKYLKKITLASLMSCYQAMLPKAFKAKSGSYVPKKYQTYLRCVDFSYPAKNLCQKKILEQFSQDSVLLKSEITKISVSAVKTLISKGVLEEITEEVYRRVRFSSQKKYSH